MIPDRDLKGEALERTNGKDYGALRKRDKEIAWTAPRFDRTGSVAR
jgi:hypothetical protein